MSGNPLSQVREDLETILAAAGLHAFRIVPQKVTPPLVYVGPGLPYVSYEGATFGGQIVHCDLGVVAGKGTNEAAAEELDEMVLAVIDVVDADERFVTGEVERPGRIKLNGQEFLATSIGVQTEIHR